MKVLCRRLLVGVTGSISAVSMPGNIAFLRRGLVEHVDVIMTEAACRLVGPAAMAAYAGTEPYIDMFAIHNSARVPHIELPRDADLMLIMPASANVLAKAAQGIADDLLSTAICACAAPIVFVPCMNGQMWNSPAVRRNVARLREDGRHVLEPVVGIEVADLQPTHGAMPPLSEIIGSLGAILSGRQKA
jgi:phosphopantothenoylcysteine decarboxylase/phosphopantothenate--cysteine ligase